jgi:hypothetical protein
MACHQMRKLLEYCGQMGLVLFNLEDCIPPILLTITEMTAFTPNEEEQEAVELKKIHLDCCQKERFIVSKTSCQPEQIGGRIRFLLENDLTWLVMTLLDQFIYFLISNSQ